jgi:hypothetical protein
MVELELKTTFPAMTAIGYIKFARFKHTNFPIFSQASS